MGLSQISLPSRGAVVAVAPARKIRIRLNELAAHMQRKSDIAAAFATAGENISFPRQGKVREPVALMADDVHAGARRGIANHIRGSGLLIFLKLQTPLNSGPAGTGPLRRIDCDVVIDSK